MLKRLLTSRWTLPVAGLVIGLVAILLIGLSLRPHTFAGTLLQSPQPAYDFTLTGPQGTPVRLSDFTGKYVMLFFGYTSCPDVCPTTLREMKSALDQLGQRADQVQAVFVSVDPEKDTPARLNAYLNNIDGRVLGLTSDLDTITQVATQYGIFFEKRVLNNQGSYVVDHTATLLLLDRKGFLRVVYPYGTAPEALASDIAYLLKH